MHTHTRALYVVLVSTPAGVIWLVVVLVKKHLDLVLSRMRFSITCKPLRDATELQQLPTTSSRTRVTYVLKSH